MRKAIKKGFTLIELLVVITIIGILATGGVSIFTKQLQGARDATRINDVKLLETAINLHFSDEEAFPATGSGIFAAAVEGYMSKPVSDPKSGQPLCWLAPVGGSGSVHNQYCGGTYILADDEYGLPASAYKLAIYFEKETNMTHKAMGTGKDTDGGTSDSMYELFAGAGAKSITITTALDYTSLNPGLGTTTGTITASKVY